MGSLQQILGGFRLAVETGQFYFGFYVIGTMGVIGGLVGRMVCGWACPFGLFQELLHKIPSPKFGIWPVLRYVKYGILIFMVILLPLFAGERFSTGDPWFCKYFCPAGTLEAGIPMIMLQPALANNLGLIFLLKLTILVLFIAWAIVASRPFCRTACPLGAFYALFSKVKLVTLVLDENQCTHCEACHGVCPMGVRFDESPDDPECITCLACTRTCPVKAITLEIGGVKAAGGKGPCGTKNDPGLEKGAG